jgi:hypothetical protein
MSQQQKTNSAVEPQSTFVNKEEAFDFSIYVLYFFWLHPYSPKYIKMKQK